MKQLHIYNYSGLAQERDRQLLRKAQPVANHTCIRMFNSDERFKTRTGAEVFAYKRGTNGNIIFYAYTSQIHLNDIKTVGGM